ncbi:MAG: 1,3-beta-galactosyl-N-acetylhexosamine phosphorylase [Propionibacteriaceae bacterium]|nr:1,3-beta-galactosyl-N-acetylhexosamine phosphorylase [Propionibacteriaceae bacterium]
MTTGRLTLPVEQGMDEVVTALIERLGADAVRNSDGTELPEIVHDLAARIYATYFVGRGDQDWALSHPDQTTRLYLMSSRTAALDDQPLALRVIDGYFELQVCPDTDCDIVRWWQVIDRTSGRTLDPEEWRLSGADADAILTITAPEVGHVYTVDFLARQLWDPTQMYNYLTNNWADDPTRSREQPFDARYPETWTHIQESLSTWLKENPDVDVVRFTTFFYHFTLVFSDQEREGFVDWFGYSASVSVPALEDFEREMGYAPKPEDFVDQGYYNSSFRVPSQVFLDWIDFQHRFVTGHVRQLVDQVHGAGKEAMMFLGDNWIGTEPYGPLFASTGLDAVVGSVGSAATCRMIADIPGVRYTEGRFLPYFFPDVFRPGGDPVAEANESWLSARRAIVRSPLDRIGYGGYLSVATQFPEFIDRVEQIVDEFRSIHEQGGSQAPATADFEVGVLNCWGRLRSWQTHMVAHALWYRGAYSYLGALESLAGLPFKVRFLNFDDIAGGVPDSVGVLVNAGGFGTAFSGGQRWADPTTQAVVRQFVAAGGGLIGIGDPSAHLSQGAFFQLSDVFGLDREIGWSLSSDRYLTQPVDHPIAADLPQQFDTGESTPGIVPLADDLLVLRTDAAGSITLAAHPYGRGRAVYMAGLPWSVDNNRLLHRALNWAATGGAELGGYYAVDPRVEVAHYPSTGRVFAYSLVDQPVATVVNGPDCEWPIELSAAGSVWLS